MRVPYSWLREYVDVDLPTGDLVPVLDMLGLPVETLDHVEGDPVFDVEVTANRPDAMSVVGVARDVAAKLRLSLRLPAAEPDESGALASSLARVEIADPDLCPRYVARMVVDVRVGPSPEWVQRRLRQAGVRPVNTVVDVTNYVMLEVGQPLHAFDYDRLAQGRIVVRRALPGEALRMLDGVERHLDPEVLVIADGARAVAVAGVMGGAGTEIGEATTRVLIESAHFDPISVRKTSRRLGVRTEASARFERGVDPNGCLRAASRAALLMQKVAGGKVLRGAVDRYPRPVAPRTVALRPERAARVLGLSIPVSEMAGILRRLGFEVSANGVIKATIPTYRPDVTLEEDLIEEVIRIYGYEAVPEAMPLEATPQGRLASDLAAEQFVRQTLVRAGLQGVITLSLVHPSVFDRLRLPPDDPLRAAVPVTNPLVEEHTHLRTTLVPGILEVLATNAARRVLDVQISETGRVFHPAPAAEPVAAPGTGVLERRHVAIGLMGRLFEGAWNLPADAVQADFYTLKGIVEALLREARIDGWTIDAAARPWLHPGRGAAVALDGAEIGTLGEVHPEVRDAYGLPRAYVADLDLDAILARVQRGPAYRPIPRHPAARRDLAVVAPAAVPAAEVDRVIRGAAGPALERLELFDVYTGPPVPEGRRSLAYTLTLRAPDRTLSAEEAEAVLARVRDALRREAGAETRE